LPSASGARCTGARWSARWRGRKKNADEEPTGPVAAANGHALAERYEALRRALVEAHERNHPAVRARALLVRKGMAAWMNGLEVARSRAAAPTVAGAEGQWPGGSQQHLVEILATMALTTAMEVLT
jgi:hypothetical protein